jgi:hypothetical protein
MSLAANPFIVLSYVSGPAILTNASALLLMSTSNRFARVIDRSRSLAQNLAGASAHHREQLVLAARRVRLIARALTSLYAAAAAFAFATLVSILGAVVAMVFSGVALKIAAVAAIMSGVLGFAGFIAGAVSLVLESRLAVQAVTQETDEALAALRRGD